MNFLRRVFNKFSGAVSDPVLGSMVREDDYWTGQIGWEHSPRPFSLTVHRANEVPAEADRNTFQALSRNYPALRTDLQGALYQLWIAARDNAKSQSPDFGGSLDLWSRVTLQGVGIHPDGHANLIYGLEDSTDFEGAFIVAVRGLDVSAVEYVE